MHGKKPNVELVFAQADESVTGNWQMMVKHFSMPIFMKVNLNLLPGYYIFLCFTHLNLYFYLVFQSLCCFTVK